MRVQELTARVYPNTSARGQRFIQKILEESALLRSLNNFSLGATDGQYRPAAGGQTLAARAKAGSYTPGDLNPSPRVSAELKIHGFELDYDETYEKDSELGIGADVDIWAEKELDERAADVADEIDEIIIAGPGTGNTMTGLSTLIDGSTDLPGLSTTLTLNAKTLTGVSGDSLDLKTNSNHYDKFLGMFTNVRKDVPNADGLILNYSLWAKLTEIAESKRQLQVTSDELGLPVYRVAGLQLIPVSDSVITLTEPDDAGTPVNETTSVYVFRNAESGYKIKSNSGLAFWDLGELLEDKMSRRMKFEFRGFNEVSTKRHIRRIRNIKI